MGSPHAGELAVVRPDKEFFFIAYKIPYESSPLRTVLPNETFKTIVAILISPKTFKAHHWRVGKNEYELVFDQPGEYTFLLGEALESDAGGDVQVCRVMYTN